MEYKLINCPDSCPHTPTRCICFFPFCLCSCPPTWKKQSYLSSLQSFITPYKTITQDFGPKPHFTAVENADQRVRVTQLEFFNQPTSELAFSTYLTPKVNFLLPAPELSARARVTHHTELSIFSCLTMYLFFVLQSRGCCGMSVHHCSLRLCAGERTSTKKGEERGVKRAFPGIKGSEIPYRKIL